ncbi:MAG: hypothetical protein KBG48_33975 [Kofleriaceae bacterium]|nr:hypothetical protein [Kofleriaceae bacterium]MBP9172419.1 hypothetical protein [Kofleriaceae bacterium]MBP9860545.1 hypothetical protein [Kofleriaceae bacterium]
MGKLRALVVGAGAVGQVYGHYLARGGADVTMFVRDKYRAEATAGYDLYHLRTRGVRAERFAGFAVATTMAEVAAAAPALVVVTVDATALDGPWLRELVAATGDATVLALQPGLDAQATYLAAGCAPDRLVAGLITLISYHAPLPGETRFPRPGMAYYLPPLTKAPHAGPRAEVVVAALTAGGFPAKVAKEVTASAALASAVMMPYLVGLELGGWRVRGAIAAGTLALGARGAREALTIAADGRPVPRRLAILTRPRVLRVALALARPALPLPLEPYLEAHFTKVGRQTAAFMTALIIRGKARGLPIDALVELEGQLRAARATGGAR